MSRLSGAALLGASVAVTGGLAYAAWTYFSSAKEEEERKTPKPPPEKKKKVLLVEEVGAEIREETRLREREGGEHEETRVSVEAAPKVSQVELKSAAETRFTCVTSQSAPAESPAASRVLVLGLDGAGKTSVLQCLSTGCPALDVQPTQGFNAVSVSREELSLDLLEIGGAEPLRQYWPRYMSGARLLVFVVDSVDSRRFSVAKTLLHQVLSSDAGLPLMVLANKQDLPGARSITELHQELGLSQVGPRPLFLIGTHVKAVGSGLSSGVQDARDLMVQVLSDRK